MGNQYIEFAAPGIASLRPYVPGKPICELEREFGIRDSIKLASNENPLGASPKIAGVIAAQMRELARYPDGGAVELRDALAKRHGVDSGCVTLGNGSNDVLDMIARVFLPAESGSLFSQYAFAVYPISSMAVGANLQIAPAREYGHDLNAFGDRIDETTRVIWIANPNNPTGTWLREPELRAFVASVPDNVIVVVDEAYFEYVEERAYPDASRWLADFPNLIVTRTFSKVHGLAALRVGYGLSHPDIADLLNRVRQPFNVNTLAQTAALAALDDQVHVARSIELNRNGLRQLTNGLDELGLAYIPSVGNFITVDMTRPAAPIDRALLQLGVITRPIDAYGMPHHLRISVGLLDENKRCLDALRTVLGR